MITLFSIFVHLKCMLYECEWGSYLLQLLLSGEAQSIHGVGPAVCPLAELVGRFGEGHVGCDCAVDDGLDHQEWKNKELTTHKASR